MNGNGRFYGSKEWHELAGRYALLQRDPPDGFGADPVFKALHKRIPMTMGISDMDEAQLRHFVEQGEAKLKETNHGDED